MIRKYNPNKDFLFILESEKGFIETHGEDIAILPNYLKKYWNHEGFNCYILEKKGIQIGYVISVYSKDGFELNTIYIRKSFRKKGYMTKLLNYLIEEISYMGCNLVAEHIENDNAAKKTLLRCGFKFKKIENNYYDNNKNSLIYERKL